MRVRWANGLTPSEARALVDTLEDDRDNPKYTERHVRGGVTLPPSLTRTTPRFCYAVARDRTISIGIPVDGWSEQAVVRERPGTVVEDDRRPGPDPDP